MNEERKESEPTGTERRKSMRTNSTARREERARKETIKFLNDLIKERGRSLRTGSKKGTEEELTDEEEQDEETRTSTRGTRSGRSFREGEEAGGNEEARAKPDKKEQKADPQAVEGTPVYRGLDAKTSIPGTKKKTRRGQKREMPPDPRGEPRCTEERRNQPPLPAQKEKRQHRWEMTTERAANSRGRKKKARRWPPRTWKKPTDSESQNSDER
jgi:hypothetical protein